MNTRSHYDVVIIGAGMSGLAAGIRLAHFGRKVCIFERHNAVGGLNGFYSFRGRKFDVGLHAMTNFVRPGVKGTPLTKLLRQLRIDRDELALSEQRQSRIAFGPHGELSLRFSNDFALLETEIAARFPAQIDGFRRLLATVRSFDDVALDGPALSARAVVRAHVSDPVLEDMLFCPLMYYGSATEQDMDFGQFVIMFKALFLEGFARPLEGVRVVLRVLLAKYRAAGGERRMKCGVRRLVVREGRAVAVELDDGAEVTADHVLSSIGGPETARLIDPHAAAASPPPGRLSFVETIAIHDRAPADLGWGEDTIVFFNESDRFDYARPDAPVDLRSGVLCVPNNFDYGPDRGLPEGVVRVTCLANYDSWAGLAPAAYAEAKGRWFGAMQASARRFVAGGGGVVPAPVATDMFTPKTIEKFTGHLGGAVYGSPTKNRRGHTPVANVYLCGTDQGFLGIVGAMLSGISMANLHVLSRG
ncbi:MAG: NAD(P)/FAD-dependent oxidoreductase [Verrucomicrobia bacterium]|nr:NAD(P)/FAD-dependent oxidoreductase [Verrucomicrobiota bacterium]